MSQPYVFCAETRSRRLRDGSVNTHWYGAGFFRDLWIDDYGRRQSSRNVFTSLDDVGFPWNVWRKYGVGFDERRKESFESIQGGCYAPHVRSCKSDSRNGEIRRNCPS